MGRAKWPIENSCLYIWLTRFNGLCFAVLSPQMTQANVVIQLRNERESSAHTYITQYSIIQATNKSHASLIKIIPSIRNELTCDFVPNVWCQRDY